MSPVERKDHPAAASTGNGNEVVAAVMPPSILAAMAGIKQTYDDQRLRINPNKEHKVDKYDDLRLEFDPVIFSSLEKHLPPSMLEVPREAKVQFLKEILGRYRPEGERESQGPKA